ncbi:5'/3'-nucleotidase SurE [Thermosyntropha sp.]|uniref:5'/3'-nucleotidase SurE n=1 Tax=Thermosyntropha sp. TaxID=2740820 RepID=UPI0025FBB4F7|nr:5'/3'-nucleotidase SurE [Thermosyntropha sp.]MBO8158370.1 5'/3'-nucleotidase SurE [Thermosyntropha sp.]
MKILVTNDDGIHAKGINALIHHLGEIAELYVAAPDRERSGTGHSITVFEPIRVKEVKVAKAKRSWVVGGTPVDCVKLAMSRLVEGVDLVVSGINHGPNLGTDVLYSGTVSAAAEGIIMGAPAIAVSLDCFEEDPDFEYAAKFTCEIIEMIKEKGIDRRTILNLNIPALKPEAIKGVRITKLGVRNYENLFEERKDPRGNTYYWLGGGIKEEQQDVDSDVLAVKEGYISITPIHLDLTDYRLLNEYKKYFTKDFLKK